jgi:hypothetical protein
MRYWISLVLLLASMSILSLAQDNATATPAPSKTPNPTATTSAEETAEVSPTPAINNIPESRALPRNYTQEDLEVIVGNVQRPNGIVYFDDFLYTACNGDWTLYRINATTGATTTFIFGVRNTHQMVMEATDAGFNLWIPDFEQDQLLLVDQNQNNPRLVVSENLDGPWGIAAVDAEHFLISNVRADNLVIVDRDGNSAVAMDGLRSPAGLVIDGNYIYLANNGSARRALEWFTIDDLSISEDGIVETVSDVAQPLVSGLQSASNLVLAADGYLYFSYALGTRGVVGRINPEECRDGGCANADVEIVLFTELPAPLAGLTITPDMRLFVHTIYRPEIYWLQLYQ